MSNDLDIDLDLEIDKALDQNNKTGLEFQYYYVNMVKNLNEVGRMDFRLVPDSNGLPMKVLHNIREGSLPERLPDGSIKYNRIRLCDKSDFMNLSSAQSALIDDLNSELDRFCSLNSEESWKFKPTKSTTIFFGIVLTNGKLTYDVLKPSLFLNTSANFIKYFQKFYNDTKDLYGNKYLIDLFNRSNEFDKFISVTQERIDYGYKFNLSVNELDSDELRKKASDEVLDRFNDLNQEYIDVVNFNDELYYEFFEFIKKYNNEIEKANNSIPESVMDW